MVMLRQLVRRALLAGAVYIALTILCFFAALPLLIDRPGYEPPAFADLAASCGHWLMYPAALFVIAGYPVEPWVAVAGNGLIWGISAAILFSVLCRLTKGSFIPVRPGCSKIDKSKA
jgi:hypothetical protein